MRRDYLITVGAVLVLTLAAGLVYAYGVDTADVVIATLIVMFAAFTFVSFVLSASPPPPATRNRRVLFTLAGAVVLGLSKLLPNDLLSLAGSVLAIVVMSIGYRRVPSTSMRS